MYNGTCIQADTVSPVDWVLMATNCAYCTLVATCFLFRWAQVHPTRIWIFISCFGLPYTTLPQQWHTIISSCQLQTIPSQWTHQLRCFVTVHPSIYTYLKTNTTCLVLLDLNVSECSCTFCQHFLPGLLLHVGETNIHHRVWLVSYAGHASPWSLIGRDSPG